VSSTTPELSNSERLELLQQGTNVVDISSSGSLMHGELGWLQDWLEEGPQPLESIEAGHLDTLPHLVVQESKEWENGALQGELSGAAQLSGSPVATGTGSFSATGENAQAGATGTLLATPGTLSAKGSAKGSVEHDGHSLAVSASGTASNTAKNYGELGATLGHDGKTGELKHSVRSTGSIDSNGNASLDGSIGGSIQKGDNTFAVSADGQVNNKGLKNGKVLGQYSNSGSTAGIDHTVRTSGSIDSSGTATLGGGAGASIQKGGTTVSASGNGQVNNKGLKSGKLLGQVNHSGSTGDLDHSVRTSGSIDSSGKTDMSIKGRIGSSDTVQEGDSTITTSAYLGAGAQLNKGLSGEVGMMRKTVSDGEVNTKSAGASVDKNGGKLSLTNKNIRERSRDSSELTFQGKNDGSSTIKLGGEASGELWRESSVVAPGVSATARALGGGAGAGVSFNRDADGGASLGANAKASLLLGEGIVYAERELGQIGETGLDWDGRVRAAAEATANANASVKLDKGVAVEAALKAFVGVRAEASTGATITWDRKDDYGPMLEDFANNLPGTWDDELLDRLPDAWWTNVGSALFGKGKTDLLRVGVGVDARAGAGAEATLSGGMSDQGMFETEMSAGAALGVGGGARLQVGFNPIDILRRGLADSIEAVNDSFNYAEVMWQYATESLGGSEDYKVEVIDSAAEEAKMTAN
jgi:hypothetical protein